MTVKISLLFFLLFPLFPALAQENAFSPGPGDLKAGGQCDYDGFIGECRIDSIRMTDDSVRQAEFLGGAGYQGYEIIFVFTPQKGVIVPENRGFDIKRPRVLQLGNSYYPGPEFIKKYKIREGNVFDCTLNLIRKGACSPVIFVFDKIDTRDYFEGENRD